MVDEGPNLVTPEGLAQIDGHIARIEAATPSRIASFEQSRLARLAELRAVLAAMPAEPVEIEDAGFNRWLESQRTAANADRAQTRRGY